MLGKTTCNSIHVSEKNCVKTQHACKTPFQEHLSNGPDVFLLPQKKIYVLIAIDMVFGSHHISYTSKHAKVREMRNPRGKHLAANTTQKEITSQTDQNLVIRSSKTYVSEDKPTKYLSIRPVTSFSVRSNIYRSMIKV